MSFIEQRHYDRTVNSYLDHVIANPGGELVQLQAIQSENEHLKSKVVNSTMFQTLQVQVKDLQSENDDLKLLVEELTTARDLPEATLRKRDEMVYA
ncbi:hypothetical protein Tco_0088919 [Tanacetum coccineum]